MIPDQVLGRWQSSLGNLQQPEPNGTDAHDASPAPSTAGSIGLTKKSILIVDTNAQSREARAKIMREHGVQVDTAATAATAHARLISGKYNLVLVDLGPDLQAARSLGAEIKARNPRQMVGFLVGSPRFVTTSLGGNGNRASRTPPPVTAEQPKPTPAAPASTDFGRRVRDAEAEQQA